MFVYVLTCISKGVVLLCCTRSTALWYFISNRIFMWVYSYSYIYIMCSCFICVLLEKIKCVSSTTTFIQWKWIGKLKMKVNDWTKSKILWRIAFKVYSILIVLIHAYLRLSYPDTFISPQSVLLIIFCILKMWGDGLRMTFILS